MLLPLGTVNSKLNNNNYIGQVEPRQSMYCNKKFILHYNVENSNLHKNTFSFTSTFSLLFSISLSPTTSMPGYSCYKNIHHFSYNFRRYIHHITSIPYYAVQCIYYCRLTKHNITPTINSSVTHRQCRPLPGWSPRIVDPLQHMVKGPRVLTIFMRATSGESTVHWW